MAIVYLHRRMDTNEVFYVGIGVDEKRPYSKYGRNKYWINIVNKHGYTVEILHENISYQECKIIEIDLIDKYGRKDLGTGSLCNLTDGGDGIFGIVFSEESRRKMSKSAIGKTVSQETRKKLSELNTGEKHPMFGKTHSDESRRKMSESAIGKTVSQETKRKISENTKGRKHSEETIKKLRELNTGVNNPMFGKTGENNPMFGKTGEKHPMFGRKHSEETIRKMSETKRKNKESLDN
jgi:hypothetical protein